jgi:hypothetical protein
MPPVATANAVAGQGERPAGDAAARQEPSTNPFQAPLRGRLGVRVRPKGVVSGASTAAVQTRRTLHSPVSLAYHLGPIGSGWARS